MTARQCVDRKTGSSCHGQCSAGACPPLGSGVGRGSIRRANSLYQATTPAFPTLAYRHQPASATAMKACPGLRSGIDRSGSLSFAIRGIPSSIRPPIRHSAEGRNPGGVGRGKTTRRWKKPTHRPTFILLCGLRKAMAIPAIKSMPRTPIRGRNPEGWGEGIVALGLVPSLGRTARSRKLHGPAYHHFPLLMRPSRGHGDSRESGNPGGEVARTHQPTPPRTT